MIPEPVIQDVKDRIDAVAVFGRHLELRRSGPGFVAPCPFHEDRSPSLRVYPDQARFHCYGCGAHGDVFAFLQRLGGKSFPAVVRELAAEVGVPIRGDAPPDPAGAERAELLAACDAAQRYFEAALWAPAGEPGRRYLHGRGISDPTARAFHLGFADGALSAAVPEGGHSLARGFLAAGLLDHADGGIHDRLRDRVTFPLAAPDGRVAGFAARTVAADAEPRYLTTRETAAYRSSRAFFGLGEASSAIRRTGSALVVSNCFDVLAAREAGVHVAVAVPSISQQQLEALRRQGARELVLLLAADRSFHPTPELAAAVFASGAMLRVARLPASTGMASAERFLRANGRTALESLAASGAPLSEYLIDEALRIQNGAGMRLAGVEAKLAAIAWLARYTAAMPQGLARNVLERRIAQRLQLTLRSVRSAARDALPARDLGPPLRRRRSARRPRW